MTLLYKNRYSLGWVDGVGGGLEGRERKLKGWSIKVHSVAELQDAAAGILHTDLSPLCTAFF